MDDFEDGLKFLEHTLVFRGKIVAAYQEGKDPYQPGVDVSYTTGEKEHLPMDLSFFLKEVKWINI